MWPPLSALPLVAEMLPLCSLHMGAAGLLQSCSRDERGRLCPQARDVTAGKGHRGPGGGQDPACTQLLVSWHVMAVCPMRMHQLHVRLWLYSSAFSAPASLCCFTPAAVINGLWSHWQTAQTETFTNLLSVQQGHNSGSLSPQGTRGRCSCSGGGSSTDVSSVVVNTLLVGILPAYAEF